MIERAGLIAAVDPDLTSGALIGCAGSPSRCCSAADVRTRATSMFGTATPFVPPATAVSHRTKSVVDHVWIQSFP